MRIDAGDDAIGRDDASEQGRRDAVHHAELDDASLDEIVAKAIAQTGASSPKDIGQVMSAAMAEVSGRADGKRVSGLVRASLQG